MSIRRQLPSTVKYFQPFIDCVTSTVRATKSTLELTELLKNTLPGDQYTIVDQHGQKIPASFGQWLIARINLRDKETAQQQAINEILGRINSIVTDTIPKSKVITPWDIQYAILRASYLVYFFETVGDTNIKTLIRDAKATPGHLPITLTTTTSLVTVLVPEEFVTGLWVTQKELTSAAQRGAQFPINGVTTTLQMPVQLTCKFMDEDLSADLDDLLKDTRYYDVHRPYNTTVINVPMWFLTVNFLLGVDYSCKLANVPIGVVAVGYSIGTDPTSHDVQAVINSLASVNTS